MTEKKLMVQFRLKSHQGPFINYVMLFSALFTPSLPVTKCHTKLPPPNNYVTPVQTPSEEAWFLANVNSSLCSLYVIVRPSVCLSSVTFVHPTQAIEIFGNVSMPCGTLTIRDLCIKILRRSSQGNPFVGG